jgi:MoaA/NifB/PqqE/SkfB family radical SAM enzyme
LGWHVSPCPALLHSSTEYLNGIERLSRRYVAGNVNKGPLREIWDALEYVTFEKKFAFDFAPCALCDGCGLSENNEEDCYGTISTCGGCLWAQGMIQCL